MTLQEKIQNKLARIGIIGVGYVGLPLAIDKVKKGFKTYVWDTNDDKINALQVFKSYIPDVHDEDLKHPHFYPKHYLKELHLCEILMICVPTPLTKDKQPDTSYIENVVRQIKRAFR